MEMEFSAKTVEEAIQRALEQLGVSREEVDVTVVEEGKPGILGLGSEPAMVRVTPLTAVPQDDATEITKAVLEKLLVLMGVEGSITSQVETVTEGTPSVTVNIHGDDLGILIGRRGQTLSSLQYLVRLMVNLQTKSRAPIIVDIEDYKQRRYRVLEDFARQIAEQVKAQDISFTFDPMSSFEQRIIHITLADDPEVTTKSVGSGKERQVIVLPKADLIPIAKRKYPVREIAKNTVWLALPDGHQQRPTIQFLDKAGIQIRDPRPIFWGNGTISSSGNRRPTSNLRGTSIKVIRPQDMPLQVANVNFDLAVTGKDWLTEHLNQFPDSPVVKLLDLKFGWVRIVAVVSQDLPVADVNDLKQLYAKQTAPIRVASEYVNIADKYARDNHLGFYQIIPTWGATEAFLPEDADLLIENTETGSTIARHNLKIIDTLFESTAHLIGNKDSIANPNKSKRIKSITESLRNALK